MVDAAQYPALAKYVYGVNASIALVERPVILWRVKTDGEACTVLSKPESAATKTDEIILKYSGCTGSNLGFQTGKMNDIHDGVRTLYHTRE